MFKNMSRDEIEKLLTTWWAIWSARCKAAIEEIVVVHAATYNYAMRSLKEAKEVQV